MLNASDNHPDFEQVQAVKQKLDTLIESAEFWPESASAEVKVVLNDAVANFKKGGPALLNEATQYLWLYYKDVASSFSAEDRIDYGIPEIASSDKVWNYVQFRHPPTVAEGGQKYEPGQSYISFEGAVAWEEEHGLQLVFEHGLRVCKVGPYDGHYTNAHAYADESLVETVYK